MKIKAIKPFTFILVLVTLVIPACMGSIETQAPSLVPITTQTPIEPESSLPTEPPQPPVQEYFTEEFDGNIDNWKQTVKLNISTAGDLNQANISVKNGFLIFDMGKFLMGYLLYKPFKYSNVQIDVRVDNRGTNLNNVLLICRVSDEGHYLVSILNSGLYKIFAFDGTKNNYIQLADGGSTKIKPGKETNEYGLVCAERTLTIYVNGNETRQYNDTQYNFQDGLIGIGVASEDQLPVKLEFDWVKISQP